MNADDLSVMIKGLVDGSIERPPQLQFCACCKTTAVDSIASFHPNNPQDFGVPEGKTRVILYAICHACRDKPDVLERMEEVMRTAILRGELLKS